MNFHGGNGSEQRISSVSFLIRGCFAFVIYKYLNKHSLNPSQGLMMLLPIHIVASAVFGLYQLFLWTCASALHGPPIVGTRTSPDNSLVQRHHRDVLHSFVVITIWDYQYVALGIVSVRVQCGLIFFGKLNEQRVLIF